MEFLTLHELSVQLDVSVRVLRHRLRQLLLAGKLIENVDCRRDDFVDDTHFVWRVDPVAFARATGMRATTDMVNTGSPLGTQPLVPVQPAATQPDNRGEQTLSKVDIKTPGLEREMIDLLKDQVRVKDTQITDLNEQNKALNTLHLKLTGQIVQQSDRIQDLLQLTGGRIDLADAANHPERKAGTVGNQPDINSDNMVNHVDNQPPNDFGQQGSALAA